MGEPVRAVSGVIAGPSGGVLGKGSGGIVSLEVLQKHPDLARQIVTTGKQPRAGHDRARWETVRWEDYRAQVGIGGRAGPWRIWAHEARDGDPGSIVTAWVAEAEGLPATPPGVYAELLHDQRGLVMSDIPAETCGALPFLDHIAGLSKPLVLIAGLGLGIVPAWLLTRADVWRVDVIEIDPDVIALVTRGCADEDAPNDWAADPRLHVYQGDAHTWWPADRRGCALHRTCRKWHLPTRYAAAWLDIWDTVSPHNLPSMDLLERRYGPLCDRAWSWERPECEAMLARGQTLEWPSCFVFETGYPLEGGTDG